MTMSFARKTAVVGIGATEFSKDSGRSPLRLAVECCDAAIRDAGLRHDQIDGIVSFSVEENDEIDVARALGIDELTHFSRIHHSGGAACGVIHQAAMAVHSGACNYALVYRAFNERSETRFGTGVQGPKGLASPVMVDFGWALPFGLLTPASWAAIFATRYMHQYGATSEDFGRISVAARKHAANNPAAFFYQKPITLEDHQASRWIVKPLHLLDCCQESDGGQALVVTTLERARDLPNTPAVIASGSGPTAGSDRTTSRPPSSTTTSRPSPCPSSKSSASANPAKPRTSSRTATSNSAAGCPSTPMGGSWARPTSTE